MNTQPRLVAGLRCGRASSGVRGPQGAASTLGGRSRQAPAPRVWVRAAVSANSGRLCKSAVSPESEVGQTGKGASKGDLAAPRLSGKWIPPDTHSGARASALFLQRNAACASAAAGLLFR